MVEELTKTFKELGLVSEKQKRNLQVYEKKSHQLTIAYLVFQAIVFISITKQAYAYAYSSSSQCQNLWLLFTLSMFSSLIYVLAFLDTMTRFYWVQYQIRLTFMDQETVKKQINEADQSNSLFVCENIEV